MVCVESEGCEICGECGGCGGCNVVKCVAGVLCLEGTLKRAIHGHSGTKGEGGRIVLVVRRRYAKQGNI